MGWGFVRNPYKANWSNEVCKNGIRTNPVRNPYKPFVRNPYKPFLGAGFGGAFEVGGVFGADFGGAFEVPFGEHLGIHLGGHLGMHWRPIRSLLEGFIFKFF